MMKSFRQYLEETRAAGDRRITKKEAGNILKSIKNADDFKKHFQKVFFGEKKGKPEVDTPIEAYLSFEMTKWVRDFTGSMDKTFFDALSLFQKYNDTYPLDLIPKAKILYRGLRGVSHKLLKRVDIRTWKKAGANWISSSASYKPISKAESWTTKRYSAASFAFGHEWTEYSSESDVVAESKENIENLVELVSEEILWKMWDEDEQQLNIGKRRFVKNMSEMKTKYPDEFYALLLSTMVKHWDVPIVYKVARSDDFLFNSKLLNIYAAGSWGATQNEHEVIRFSLNKSPIKGEIMIPKVFADFLEGDDVIKAVNQLTL